MNAITPLTEQPVSETVEQPGLTVIDFWAGWCGPCRAMAAQAAA